MRDFVFRLASLAIVFRRPGAFRPVAIAVFLGILIALLPAAQPEALAVTPATLGGRVTDAATGTGLLAVVSISGGGAGGRALQTSSTGYYTITLPPGKYRVTATRSGYTSVTQGIYLASGARARLDFALRPLQVSPTNPTPTPRPTATPAPAATPVPTPSGSATPAPSPGTAGTFNVPTAIRADCSVDVTAGLLAWITSVPNYATLVLPSGGCYRIDGSLRISDRWGLVFEGNGTTFRAVASGDVNRRHFWFWGGGNLVLRNLTVRGANPNAGTSEEAYDPDREFQHAFAFQGVQGALLDRVQAYDLYGDFVYVGPQYLGQTLIWSRNITVQRSRFERNGRQGITVVAGEDVLISGNYLADVRRATFNMEPTASTWGARRVRIVNNTTGRGRLLWLSSYGQGYNVNEIYVGGNVMLATTGTPVIFIVGPAGGMRGPITVENNTFMVSGSPASAFRFDHMSGIIMRNNRATMPVIREMTAVSLNDAAHVQIVDNAFCGAKRVLNVDELSFDYYEGNNTLNCP